MDYQGEMEIDEFAKIFITNWPAIFDLIFQDCKIIYKDKHNIPMNLHTEKGEVELNIAKAIIKDLGWKEARKIGRLLIDATE